MSHLTWKEMVAIEPRLAGLDNDVASLGMATANKWMVYELAKDRMEEDCLCGFGAAHYELSNGEAWDVAIAHFAERLGL